jgi:hypothetical protein
VNPSPPLEFIALRDDKFATVPMKQRAPKDVLREQPVG